MSAHVMAMIVYTNKPIIFFIIVLHGASAAR